MHLEGQTYWLLLSTAVIRSRNICTWSMKLLCPFGHLQVLTIMAEAGPTKVEQSLAGGELQYIRVLQQQLDLGDSLAAMLTATDVMTTATQVLGLPTVASQIA